MRWPILGIVGTVVVHLGVGVFIAYIPKDAGKRSHLIAVVEQRKKKKEEKKKEEDKVKAPEEPPPPPKTVTAPRPKPKAAPEPAPPPPPTNAPAAVAAAHPALAALPDLGISMAGGPGIGGGIAVPSGHGGGDAAAAAKAADAPRAAARPKDDCTEAPVKPKLLGAIAQEGIRSAAQAAGGVEGRIRLALQIDENGNVTSVSVMAGLGGAIDAAAVAAAKRVKVAASTHCGKPVAGRLVIAITVRNPD